MNGWALLGIFLILYSVLVVMIAFKKYPVIWNMKKIEVFKKILGEKGTVIFFYIWASLFLALGIWLLVR